MHILNHTWLQENTCQMRNNWTIALHYRMCTLCFTNHQQWGCSNDQAPECTAHLGVAVGSTQLASPLRVDISIGIELVWSDHTVDATGTMTEWPLACECGISTGLELSATMSRCPIAYSSTDTRLNLKSSHTFLQQNTHGYSTFSRHCYTV